MEEQTLEMVTGDSDQDIMASLSSDTGQGNLNSINGSDRHHGGQQNSPNLELNHPVFQKLEYLSMELQNLKNDKIALSMEVKGILANSSPKLEIVKALQSLRSEYENLENMYNEERLKRKQFYNEVIEPKNKYNGECSDTGHTNVNPINEGDQHHGDQDNSSDLEPNHLDVRKTKHLGLELQNLKNDMIASSIGDKGILPDSSPKLETVKPLQNLYSEHEIMENKCKEECFERKQLYDEMIELKRRYNEECFERKRLYNEVVELKGNIKVFCRCRPLSSKEIANGSSAIVEFDSSHENILQILCPDSSKKHFKFDHVFKPEDNQARVFAQISHMVISALDGYNVCIFAYGQTGTGKTFTMEGTPDNRGVNYRTVEELFRISKDRSTIMKFEFFVSMLEVYNDTIRDLLVENSKQPAKKLEIKQSGEGTQEVPGLVEARVYSTDDVWNLLMSGSQVRSVGSTQCNELSSRSHCLLRVTVKGENLINGQRCRSHLWLVDLAGSERASRVDVEGERLKESQFINKSLSALGDVTAALAAKTAHVPYRNSKLTHLLQSSLGGDCKTLMFVQISPSINDFGETICSLNFASRVGGIELGPPRKHVDNTELLKYKQMVEKLKHDEKETKRLHDSLFNLQLSLSAREHTCKTLQSKVQMLEKQLAEEKANSKQESKALSRFQKPPLSRKPAAAATRKSIMPPLPMKSKASPLQAQRLKHVANKRNSIAGTGTSYSSYLNQLEPNNHSMEPRRIPRRSSLASFSLREPAPLPNWLKKTNSNNNTGTLSHQSSSLQMRFRRRSFKLSPMKLRGTKYEAESSKRLMESPYCASSSTPKLKSPNLVYKQKKNMGWDPLNRAVESKRRSFLP